MIVATYTSGCEVSLKELEYVKLCCDKFEISTAPKIGTHFELHEAYNQRTPVEDSYKYSAARNLCDNAFLVVEASKQCHSVDEVADSVEYHRQPAVSGI